jgi:uncharacterized protein YecT (DUF1311 family)
MFIPHDESDPAQVEAVHNAQRAWTQMRDRALNMARTAEIENEIDPPNEQDQMLLEAGISIGIAAAAEHYKLNPQDVPT